MSSELFRNIYKGKLPPLPPQLDESDNENENDDEIGELHDKFSILPAIHPSKMSGPSHHRATNRYGSLDWKDYFDIQRLLEVSDEDDPEADITFNIFESKGKPGAPLFVMHHGAGHSALSYALTAREIRKTLDKNVSILSFDCRGHDRLAKDLVNIISTAYGEENPDIVLVGHSMGGAVISEAASRGIIPNLIGVAVLDIVEGVAIETLSNMNGWLERRPNIFRSLDKVIQWGVKSGTVRNVESARVSFPPLVVLSEGSTPETPCYIWRTDLAASEQYWKGWFTGLTQKFLSAKAGKLLILAGTDRLDKDMTIAQMQDPQQMVPSSGASDSTGNNGGQHVPDAFPSSGAITANGNGTGNTSHSRKPSHLSINSTTANSAFFHTLNSQLQIAANAQSSNQRHQKDSVSENDFPLSIGIDRAALISSNFNTDEFLSARRHLPLEELKSQLISHMKALKNELIELINSDYADFINLSTNLNGVDKMMDDLQKPLDRMKGDATNVRENLQSVIESLEQKLQHRAEIREKKSSLQLLLDISGSVAKVEGLLQISSSSESSAGLRDNSESVAKRLERVAIEYNQMQYLVTKGAGLPFVTNIEWNISRSALSDQQQHSNSTQTQQRPLVIMYSRVLLFINTHCVALINVTQKELKGTNFDIPVNCIWAVVANAILKNISHILTVGIPDDFHQNYMDTMDFVSKIEELCGSRKSLTRLRTQANYQGFMKRWQLPAYFLLRSKNITMSVEDALQTSVDTSLKSSSPGVHLPASTAIIQAIERCWSPDVYIYGIASSFWMLTLQIMARYSIWVANNLSRDLDPPNERSLPSRSSSPSPGAGNNRQQGRSTPGPSGPIRPPGPVGRISLEEMILQHLSMIVHDVDFVVTQTQTIFDRHIRPKLPPSIADEPILIESFEQSLTAIRKDIPAIQQRIIDLITKHCSDTLIIVKTFVPRAGEGAPIEPSHFVPLILAPLSKFLAGPGSVLKDELKESWTNEVITATTNQYSTILGERLTYVLHQEETSKRLAAGARAKPAQKGYVLQSIFSSGSENETNMPVNDKLRIQCVLDVRSYKSELARFINPDSFQPYLDLEANILQYESLLR
ncbi:Conserved oligomeric Golgi complex subunit 2 [Entomortierella beljakovae]|nr:Conserved oligomeric Golgi complex subunit 2 [Entomortierella beljakovae]